MNSSHLPPPGLTPPPAPPSPPAPEPKLTATGAADRLLDEIERAVVEATKRAGSLDGVKIRDRILSLDLNTVFGAFKVDQDGLQVAHKYLLFQWQDGKKVIVWPEELAPGKPRFPTPPWSQRQ